MDSTERLVQTWMASGREEEIKEIASGMLKICSIDELRIIQSFQKFRRIEDLCLPLLKLLDIISLLKMATCFKKVCA